MNCKVSIITVCFNAEKEIRKTLQSVLGQSFKSFEYIIKDGNSTDTTNQIVKKYIPLFEKKQIIIKHIVSEDLGIYDAMNQSVKYCNGEWVIFMNAGDCFYNDNVLTDVFISRNWNGIDVIYGHTLMKLSNKYAIIINHDSSYIEEEWSMNHQSIFERLEVLKRYPFDSTYKIVADYDHLLCIHRNYSFAKCNVIISIMNREGVSNYKIALRNKEDGILYAKYNLKKKAKNHIGSLIKENIRKLIPCIESFFYAKNSMERILKYSDEGQKNTNK